MIKGHILHNENGQVVAILNDNIAGKILATSEGRWVDLLLKNNKRVQAFKINESGVVRLRGCQIYIEPGYSLRRNDSISVDFL